MNKKQRSKANKAKKEKRPPVERSYSGLDMDMKAVYNLAVRIWDDGKGNKIKRRYILKPLK